MKSKSEKIFAEIALAILLATVGFADTAHAQANNNGTHNFGLGLMFGEPTGVTVKSWFDSRSAFDIGAAWSLSDRNEAVHLHADYLHHNWFNDNENLAFYFGVGARIIFSSNATAGIRVPLGLNYVFENAPFDLFVEAVPIIDISPDIEFAGNGGVGIRYYF
ncbi:BAPKO_0422 family outer member beta-barrel protein [Rhodohalobacter sp. 8-1]|uniref:BAPKO_0422 family outer member beta-barrel protein n=1 Tax=Rhodohalobacter sp. 8-1 TaxID=3131972 RepID=UPI0030EE866E